MERTFIFYPDWLDCIDKIGDKQDQYDLMKIIMDYGCRGEYNSDNKMMIAIFDSLIKPKIDVAQSRYTETVNAGKQFGRKKKIDDGEIAVLAQAGVKAKDIAARLGISADAVYHSDGWKLRDKNL